VSKVSLETIRAALAALKAAGVRVHHVELGYLAWERLRPELRKLEQRDDLGFGSHPATLDTPRVTLPLLEGVALTIDALLPCGDQWAIVFGVDGDAATDYPLTPGHRAMYAGARLR
jgi:hypothetical protein